jgi:hypothetical protein
MTDRQTVPLQAAVRSECVTHSIENHESVSLAELLPSPRCSPLWSTTSRTQPVNMPSWPKRFLTGWPISRCVSASLSSQAAWRIHSQGTRSAETTSCPPLSPPPPLRWCWAQRSTAGRGSYVTSLDTCARSTAQTHAPTCTCTTPCTERASLPACLPACAPFCAAALAELWPRCGGAYLGSGRVGRETAADATTYPAVPL